MSISGYHAHDAYWHMAIAETAFETFPPAHPIFAGANLTHYNYLFDYFLFLLKRFGGVSVLHGYFHVFPVVIALLYIGAVTIYTRYMCSSDLQKLLTSFVLYLGNSFAFLMTIFSSGTLVSSSVRGFPLVLSLQPTLMFFNLQFALSLPIILLLIVYWNRRSNGKFFIPVVTMCFGIVFLTLLKAYAGIALLFYLLVHTAHQAYSHKLSLKNAVTICAACSISFILVSLAFGGGKGVFVYDPFAFIRSLIDDPSHFFRNYIALARVTLETSGQFSPRLILMYGVFTALFYVVNFGMRLGFVWHIRKIIKRQEVDPHLAAVLTTTLTLSSIPLFFVQKGDWFNTMQFLYYAVFLSSLISVSWIVHIRNCFIKLFVVAILIITSCIPLVDQLKYGNHHDYTILSSDFIETTISLRSQPPGIVSTFGSPAQDSRITAFTGKRLLLGDIPVLKNTFIEYEVRENEYKKYPYDTSTAYIWVDKLTHLNWHTFFSPKKVISQNDSFALVLNK